MAAPKSTIQHFIYPLNPKAGYRFDDAGGALLPTSYEGFLDAVKVTEPAEWGLSTSFLKVRAGALLWAYFVKPDGAIRGVGRVRADPHWNEEWAKWAIYIEWDRPLIARLARDPIPYESYRQHVQAGAIAANESTAKVLEHWLSRHQGRREHERDKTVAFVSREVAVRLGQPAFRAALEQAYGNACAISGCTVGTVLQAAHIRAVK